MSGREYVSGARTLESQDAYVRRVEAVSKEEIADFLDGMVQYYENHDLLKFEHIDPKTGAACLEGCAIQVAHKRILTTVDDLVSVKSVGAEAERHLQEMLGLKSPEAEIIANAAINYLRLALAPYVGMELKGTKIGDNDWDTIKDVKNPVAVFNDLPETDKNTVVRLLKVESAKLRHPSNQEAVNA